MADQVGALMTTGIGEFISNRWKEAREHLAQIDSAFVNSVNVWDSLKERGIILENEEEIAKDEKHKHDNIIADIID